MEHITANGEEVINDMKTSKEKICTAKKKSKKTKDNNQNDTSNKISLDNCDIIENIKVHTNNGMTNGLSEDHESESDCQINKVNNCERLDCETDKLAERIGNVDISDSIVVVDKCQESLTESKQIVSRCPECNDDTCTSPETVTFESYKSELQMGEIMRLIQKDLSEPYSIYTYRYFIHNWPKLCFLAMHNKRCIGAIVCKLDLHRKVKRGYIAMLAVDEKFRKRKIGSHLVRQAITAMVADDADEVVLETEITNKPALRLYGNLGFVRDKRLFRYYLNGVDALRLKLWLR